MVKGNDDDFDAVLTMKQDLSFIGVGGLDEDSSSIKTSFSSVQYALISRLS